MKHTEFELRVLLAEAIRSRRRAWRACDKALNLASEQQERRLDIEVEMRALEELLHPNTPLIRYVERKVYKPMPPKEIIRWVCIERRKADRPAIDAWWPV